MNDLRKAAENILKVLDGEPELLTAWLGRLKEAREALRQALEQPKQEPICAHGVCKTKCDFCKQPEQEPVAWMYEWNGEKHLTFTDQSFVEKAHPHFNKSIPLYTAPPKRGWVELTKEELSHAYCEVSGKEWCLGGLSNAHTFYEAIEAKLKEKNHG